MSSENLLTLNNAILKSSSLKLDAKSLISVSSLNVQNNRKLEITSPNISIDSSLINSTESNSSIRLLAGSQLNLTSSDLKAELLFLKGD
jgi:hypothetical protein